MGSWRLNWLLKQIFSRSGYAKQRKVLKSLSPFYLSLLLKFFPSVYKKPISLKLKNGGQFFINDFMSLYIYNEIFIEHCYDYPSIPGKNPVIIDIGANTGLFALRMKQLYPAATLYCYEPFPSNFAQLSENIEASNLNDVTIVPKGVGGNSRTEHLYINNKNLGGHSLFASEAHSNDSVEIAISGIEEVLNYTGNESVDLIKMDCEGAEYEILKAITPEMVKRIKVIIFESTESVYDINELTDYLTAIGFRLEFQEKSCNYIAYS
jgi:FkbM family methyltransferase